MMGDPNALFNMMSGGKDSVSASEITDPRMQRMFSRFTNDATGPVSRDQFAGMMQQAMANGSKAAAACGKGGRNWQNGGQGGPGGNPAGNADMVANWAESRSASLDTNNDGKLSYDEYKADENLLAEKDKWDADMNGFIDLNEFKSYFQARVQQNRNDRNQAGDNGTDQGGKADEEKRPVVYRKGKLPKELPSWFIELDTDGDAQVALYEWKKSTRPIQEFLSYDLNGDGFLTVEEVLRADQG